MKTRSFVTLLLFFCIIKANSQEISNWSSEKLQGKVKLVKTSSYKTAEKFGEIEKTTKLYTTVAAFNSYGYLTSYFFDDGKKSETTEYKYNKNKQLTEYNTVQYRTPVMLKFTYNSFGKIAEVNKYNKQSGDLMEKQKNTYSDDNSLTKSSWYNADGSPAKTTEFDYFPGEAEPFWNRTFINYSGKEENRLIRIKDKSERVEWLFEGKTNLTSETYAKLKNEIFRAKDEISQFSATLTLDHYKSNIAPLYPDKTDVQETTSDYNNQQQLIKKTERERKKGAVDFELKSETTYEYDQYGNITLERTSRLLYVTYKYTYDKYGNWLTQLESHKAGDSIFSYLTERSITYY